jgi:hypothetical protein
VVAGHQSYAAALRLPGAEKIPSHIHVRELNSPQRLLRLAEALAKRGYKDDVSESSLTKSIIMKNQFRRLAAIVLTIVICPVCVFGQTAPPAADIFLVDMKMRNGRIELGKPVKITDWHGYDNQPMFLSDDKSLFYTSIRDDGQADIYCHNIADNTSTRITQTSESEFSPTIMPDGQFFSVIRVEKDSTQRLWKFPLAGGAPSLVLENVKPVGYHAWGDPNTVVMFVLGNPITMQIADTRTGKAEVVAQDIGRSLHKIPQREAVSFVHKVSEKEWLIKQLDLKTREIAMLVKTLPGSEDYAWSPQGILLMGKEAKLYQYDLEKDADWQEIMDFTNAGMKSITRLAVSPKGDRLAVVAISTL